jgi:uracil-DNA glycosylase
MNDKTDTLLRLWFETMNLGYAHSSFTNFSQSQKTCHKDPLGGKQIKKVQSNLSKAQNTRQLQKSEPQEPAIIIHRATALERDIDDPLVHATRQLADKIETLNGLYDTIRDFNGCALKQTANNTVIFDGIATSKVMLIGEAPGSQEDEKGIPFCGDSGKLLDLILQSIGLSREKNVYITNTVFWRPPANRSPTDLEVAICRPFLEKHIYLVKPKLLILVGSTALSALFGKEKTITKVRRNYYEYSNKYLKKPLTATAIFHPAYLLRQPMKKKDTWFDMLAIEKFLHSS